MFAHTPAPDRPALLHSYVQRAGAFQPPHVGAEPDGSTAVTAMMRGHSIPARCPIPIDHLRFIICQHPPQTPLTRVCIRYEAPGIRNHANGEITCRDTQQHEQAGYDHTHPCHVPPQRWCRKGYAVSVHTRPARDRVDQSDNVAGFRRSQQNIDRRQFHRLARAAHGGSYQNMDIPLRLTTTDLQCRPKRAGGHGVHADTTMDHLLGQRLDEGNNHPFWWPNSPAGSRTG